jgi:hypothetical protein
MVTGLAKWFPIQFRHLVRADHHATGKTLRHGACFGDSQPNGQRHGRFIYKRALIYFRRNHVEGDPQPTK